MTKNDSPVGIISGTLCGFLVFLWLASVGYRYWHAPDEWYGFALDMTTLLGAATVGLIAGRVVHLLFEQR
jgi:hypothetical protein